MSIRKTATATLFDPRIFRKDDVRQHTAHRVDFDYTPRPGYLYVRSRMISSRCNDNFDEFTPEEIKGDGRTVGYVTFNGKPVFVNHHNENHYRMRGLILQAKLHEDFNRDGSPDTWSEGLMEVDAVTFPRLARAILKGDIDRTSMGVDVERSMCSKCANVATTPLEYCRHIPAMKGSRIRVVTASGSVQNHLVRERCFGLRFFENSLLVEEPADPTAYFLDKPIQGPAHTASKAHRFEGVGLDQDGDGWFVHTHRARSDSYPSPEAIPQGRVDFIRSTGAKKEKTFMDLKVGVRRCAMCYSPNTVAMASMNECTDCGHIGSLTEPSFSFDAAKAAPGGQHKFFEANPVSHANVVDHWNQATDDEKDQGKRWYADAHLIAKGIASLHHGPEHPRGNVHLAAGLVGNYSPQTPWDANKHNAARVMHEGKGRGGKGEGIMATARQKTAANRMLAGESHEDVLTPDAHKVHAFTHLVEHGGDADPTHPRVCVDRHALSVATGKRMSDDDYGAFPKNHAGHYHHVASAYHQASHHISEAEGEHVPPHAVQATTWLVRQRLNQQGEKEQAASANAGGGEGNQERLNRGRTKSRDSSTTKWEDFRDKHLPGVEDRASTGYSDAQERLRAQPTPPPTQQQPPQQKGASARPFR